MNKWLAAGLAVLISTIGGVVGFSHHAYAAATITQDSLGTSPNYTNETNTATLKIHSSVCTTLTALTVAVRSSSGTNLDFPDKSNVSVCPSGYTYTGTKTFAAGSYTIFGAYEIGTTWTNLPQQTMTIVDDPNAPPVPQGPGGSWNLMFQDEFNGTSVDTTKWTGRSPAESDWSSSPLGTGNPGNKQLEFDQLSNCSVSGGTLKITTKPDSITSSSGHHYNWSSCLLTSTPSYNFRYGFIETKVKMPALKGDWPAFWTWAHPGQSIGGNGETDAYEYYSDNKTKFYQTQHNTGGGSCTVTPSFDPTAGFHTIGVDIESTGTTWYIDGVQTCHVATTSGGMTDIILDNFVFADIPPAPGTTQSLETDYVRGWQH